MTHFPHQHRLDGQWLVVVLAAFVGGLCLGAGGVATWFLNRWAGGGFRRRYVERFLWQWRGPDGEQW